MNSSPPRRATVSSSRRQAVSRCGDRRQQQVADRVAERVVDVLEAIEVEEQHGELAAPAVGAGDRLSDAVARAACGWAGRSARRGGPCGPRAGRRGGARRSRPAGPRWRGRARGCAPRRAAPACAGPGAAHARRRRAAGIAAGSRRRHGARSRTARRTARTGSRTPPSTTSHCVRSMRARNGVTSS